MQITIDNLKLKDYNKIKRRVKMDQQYVTIKEFATLANVTTQAVYKRLNQSDNALNDYVQYNGKMKLISKDALTLFEQNSEVTEPLPAPAEEVQPQPAEPQHDMVTACFDATLKVLTDQITAKDTQIKDLMDNNADQHNKMQEQLAAKDRQIAELQKLIDQQQQLHRAEQEQFRMLTTSVANEKKGLFRRLFHRKEQLPTNL